MEFDVGLRVPGHQVGREALEADYFKRKDLPKSSSATSFGARPQLYRGRLNFCRSMESWMTHSTYRQFSARGYPDHREDPKNRSLIRVPTKYPLVVWVPKLGDLLFRSSRKSGCVRTSTADRRRTEQPVGADSAMLQGLVCAQPHAHRIPRVRRCVSEAEAGRPAS